MRPSFLTFILFFISGFCGLLYQVVWIRWAFSSFGIITPVLSVVISIFMLGLGVGSWWGGEWTRRHPQPRNALRAYALCEGLIGLGAIATPWLFKNGELLLLHQGEMRSLGYLFCSALILAGSLLPWCLCMGWTFPLMMAAQSQVPQREN